MHLFSHEKLGVFHGLLNPPSSRSIVESYIFPVLMYGFESWTLNSSLFWSWNPEAHSSTIEVHFSLLAPKCPLVCARHLCNKLSILHGVPNGEPSSLSTQVLRSLTCTLLAILKTLYQTLFVDRKCPMEHCSYIVPADFPWSDFFTQSTTPVTSPRELVEWFISLSSDSESFLSLLSVGLSLHK